ncbi:MAG TPA: type 1 glutamine amidotransferase domain-containing protein, partial [Alteromonas macleodii]|nr:type 1 glutamine amidotransferase domain-containing protein [Alteromonas macleodii]
MKSASSILSLAIIAGLSQSAYAADVKAANA